MKTKQTNLNIGVASNGALKISQPDQCVSALREDYAGMQEMFFGEPPEFGAMMAALNEWEAQFNRKRNRTRQR